MKVLVAGDYYPTNRVAKLINACRYQDVFGDTLSIIRQADYCIVNYESCIASKSDKPIKKCGPNLSSDVRSVEALRWAGFNCVTLANNHFYDFGDSAVTNTIKEFENNDLEWVGGGHNLNEASRVLYKQIGGKTLAIINACEHEFSIATKNKGGSNPLSAIKQYYAIKSAKSKADYVLVIIHGGHETCQYPSPRMKELYRFFIDCGADAVVNHHQHCVSGYEFYNDRPIVYGVGNYSFDGLQEEGSTWNLGYLVTVDFSSFSIRIDPFVQGCPQNAGIHLLQNEERADAIEYIEHINSVISNDALLQREIEHFYETTAEIFRITLEPYNNRYLKKLFSLGFLPSFAKKKKYCIMNYMNCESHIDRLRYIISHL